MKHIKQPVLKTVLNAIRQAPVAQRKSRLDIVLQARMITPEIHEQLVKDLCRAD